MCWPERADAWVVIVSTLISVADQPTGWGHKRENCLWSGFTVEVELKVIGSSE